MAALAPLFAPYLGRLQATLEPALLRLLQGQFNGERTLLDGRRHPYLLRWSGSASPSEPCSCELSFPNLPAIRYSFTVPAQQLLAWLAQVSVAGEPADLPDGFWRWLILGEE